MRTKLEVRRVHARPVVALVSNDHARRNRAVREAICCAARRLCSLPVEECAIASGVLGAAPQPALGRLALREALAESFFWRHAIYCKCRVYRLSIAWCKYIWSKCTQTAEGVFSAPMGSASGAEKARETRARKAALRARSEAALDTLIASEGSEQISTDLAPISTEANSDSLIPATQSEVSASGQRFAEALADAVAPEAVRQIVSIMRRGTSDKVKLSAACKLIDMTVLRDRAAGAGVAADESMTGRLARAFQLRQQAAGAVDVTPIRDDSVTPEGAVHSTRRADK